MATRSELLKQQVADLERKGQILSQQLQANPSIANDPEFKAQILKTQQQIQTTRDQILETRSDSSAESTNKQKRTIECPDCNGEQYVNTSKKNTIDLQGFFGKVASSMRVIINVAKPSELKDRESLYKNGCPTCEGKKTYEDKTDRSQQIQAAAQEAQALQKEIVDLEAKLGPPGGNRHTIVVGDDMLEVGLGYNDSPSYAVIEDGSLAPGGVQMEEEAPMRVSQKVNAVVGANPLAIPGGHYTIKCGNKFTVRAGAQGIELSSEGPLTIKAGQTQIVGPEITIGSAVGQVAIEGQALSINGEKSLSLNAGSGGKGQVVVNGTLYGTGNMVMQGGAHIEGDLSFISATCPGVTTRTKHSSSDIQTTGAATWSGQAASNGLLDFKRTVGLRAGDAGGIALSPRQAKNIAEDVTNLLKKSLPVEPKPTGWCTVLYGSSAGLHPIFNFPHHHGLGDSVHAHDDEKPAIRTTQGCKSVRMSSAGKTAPGPVTANVGDPGADLFSTATNIIKGLAAIRLPF
jgi:hypothetical protein